MTLFFFLKVEWRAIEDFEQNPDSVCCKLLRIILKRFKQGHLLGDNMMGSWIRVAVERAG